MRSVPATVHNNFQYDRYPGHKTYQVMRLCSASQTGSVEVRSQCDSLNYPLFLSRTQRHSKKSD